MKRNIVILAASMLALNAAHAQFNTIGDVKTTSVRAKNPSKPVETLKDSVEYKDTVAEPSSVEMEGKETLVSSSPCVSLPLKNIQINSKFGMRKHPIYHRYIMHNGVDLQARYEEVRAILPGHVIRVGYDKRSGNFVTVQSGDFTISYCHLSKVYVHKDDFVYAGDFICRSGNTGASTGPHLHLTVKKNGKAINPTVILDFVEKKSKKHLMCTAKGCT